MTGLVAGAALALAVTAASAQQGSTLAQVKQRGVLNCGANTGLAGFGVPDAHATGRVLTSTIAALLLPRFLMTQPRCGSFHSRPRPVSLRCSPAKWTFWSATRPGP